MRRVWDFIKIIALPVAILIVFAAILVFLWYVPQWQLAGSDLGLTDRIPLETGIRAVWAAIIGGLLLFAILYYTLRQLSAIEKTLATSQEMQTAERYATAIQQLGSENLAVRLGGIYSLEQIARDSEKDRRTIAEVLTAYVRDNAPWRGSQPSEEEIGPDWESIAASTPPKTDVQAILTILGRWEQTVGKITDFSFDLGKTDLRKAELYGANLRSVNLSEAHLEEADLKYANLQWTNLKYAHLEGATLADSHMERALLVGAHLEGAMLYGAIMKSANMERAHLEGAMLYGANLKGANLDRAHLEGATLTGAVGLVWDQLREAYLDDNTELPDYLQAQAYVERQAG